MVDLRKVVMLGFVLVAISLLVPALEVLGSVGSVIVGVSGIILLVRKSP